MRKIKIILLFSLLIIIFSPAISLAQSGTINMPSDTFRYLCNDLSKYKDNESFCASKGQRVPTTAEINATILPCGSSANKCGESEVPVCCYGGLIIEQIIPPKKPLFVIPVMEISIPTVKLSSSTCTLNDDNTYACSFPWIGEYINGIYKYGINIAGILAALVLMGGGLLWLISGGDASKITQAKDMIIGSVTGLIILMASYIILTQVNPDLVKMKSIGLNTIKKVILQDADVTVVGGENPYADACTAAKKGDLSLCQKYGDAPVQNLGTVEGIQANKDVITKYQAAMECVLNKNGRKLLFAINEGWRSAATQIQYKTTYGDGAATPCCSNHGTGKALDLKRMDGQKMSWAFNDSSGLKDCMNQNGLYANLNSAPDEPWHWSLTGR